jgi:hypothetical protein
MKKKPSTHEHKLRRLVTSGNVLFALSLVYLFAEAYFNSELLKIAGSVRSSAAEIDRIQHFGRAISAAGGTLLVLGIVVARNFSGAGFWRAFGIICLVCVTPFIATLLGLVGTASIDDSFVAFVPVICVALAVVFRRQRAVVIGLVALMVWCAAYIGQKILIEEAIVRQTSAEDRLNARYALMLRAGFEDCAITLDDLRLCDTSQDLQTVKTARVILGALWMLYPDGVRQDMIRHREEILISAARRGTWISPQKAYADYAAEVKKRRQDIEDEIDQKLYAPYVKASEEYAAALRPENISRHANGLGQRIEAGIDAGWVQYQNAVRDFKNEVTYRALETVRQVRGLSGRLNDTAEELCRRTGRCGDVLERVQRKSKDTIDNAGAIARRKFADASGGYDPDISSRAGFAYHHVTQNEIRSQLLKEINKRPGLEGFTLPLDWRYDPRTFGDLMERIARVEADARWQKNAQVNIRPGLPREVFLEAAGIEPVPALEKLLITPDAFFDKVLLPKHREIAVQMFDKMTAEMPDYAEGKPLAEQGRSYVRAAYIPSLSLVISLLIVFLTLSRGVFYAAKRWMPYRIFKYPAAFGVVLLLLTLPYAAPNAYVANKAYQRYLAGAKQGHPLAATVLDWTLHTQPVVYSIGARFR